jgi:hypothetical protein
MVNINFDEPSVGQVNDDNKVALQVKNTGKGGAIQGNDGSPSGFSPNNPFGMWGDSGTQTLGGGGNGVVGSSRFYSGVAGFTLSNDINAAGVYGRGRIGVAGGVNGSSTFSRDEVGVGVYGTGSNSSNLGGIGVQGVSDTSVGVVGESSSGIGVRGMSDTSAGVHGISNRAGSVGVRAWGLNGSAGVAAISNDAAGIWIGGVYAGQFWGAVNIYGNLSTSGTKSFKIDHPLDPSNKYLYHSSVESSDMKNVYDGVVVLDAKGEAVVVLAAWLEALNKEFRYQLTPMGAPAPNLHIAEEIKNQRFKIAGGSSRMKVCWQVTGIRQDASAQAHPLVVEQDKSENERGYYLHPEAHGYPAQKSILEAQYPEEIRQFREEQKKVT